MRNAASTTSITAGAGLTGGGPLNSSTDITVNVGAGTGILVAADSVAIDPTYFAGLYQPLDADLTSWAAITRASGFDTFVATPTSANLASLVTDENGSGKLIFASGTLAITAAKTLTATNTLTLSGTDSTTHTFPSTSSSVARTDAAQSFTGLQTFDAGISLGANGTITSAEVDGSFEPAFDLIASEARTTDPMFRLRNSSSAATFLLVSAKGENSFGPTAVSVQSNVLAFNVNDSLSLGSSGGSWQRGVASSLIHGSVAGGTNVVIPTNGAVAIYGSYVINTGTVLTTTANIAGVGGVVNCAADTTNFAGKQLAGVIGRIGPASATADPFAAPAVGHAGAAGNWARVAALHAPYFNSFNANTNNPAIASGVYAAIPRQSPTECWGLETDNPTGGNARAVGIVGAAKFVFPAFGTRTTHTYWVPKAAAALGPVGNASGDVYFDSGANNTGGLWEFSPKPPAGVAAWNYLLSSPGIIANGAVPAVLGFVGAVGGPAVAAQATWVQVNCADNVVRWIPAWV